MVSQLLVDGEPVKATMLVKSLTSNERLLLQTGAVLSVQVDRTDDSGGGVVVRLVGPQTRRGVESPSSSSSSSSYRQPDARRSMVSSQSNPDTTTALYSNHPPVTAAGATAKVKAPKLLLNDLKTGMELHGYVIQSTPYSAFLNVGVFRPGKGGVLKKTSAFLHRSDIHGDMLRVLTLQQGGANSNSSSSSSSPSSSSSNSNSSSLLLNRGVKLTVFVKEIFKNSG